MSIANGNAVSILLILEIESLIYFQFLTFVEIESMGNRFVVSLYSGDHLYTMSQSQ